MAKAEHTSDARVLVGIDISKNRHEVLIAVPGKARRHRMAVLNTADDYRRLIDVLRAFDLPVTIGFEATGSYHRALMFALGSAGFELNLVSSVALARMREFTRASIILDVDLRPQWAPSRHAVVQHGKLTPRGRPSTDPALTCRSTSPHAAWPHHP